MIQLKAWFSRKHYATTLKAHNSQRNFYNLGVIDLFCPNETKLPSYTYIGTYRYVSFVSGHLYYYIKSLFWAVCRILVNTYKVLFYNNFTTNKETYFGVRHEFWSWEYTHSKKREKLTGKRIQFIPVSINGTQNVSEYGPSRTKVGVVLNKRVYFADHFIKVY